MSMESNWNPGRDWTFSDEDMMRFMCDFGYVMSGSPSLLCTSAGEWNGTVPECIAATCPSLTDNEAEGLTVYRDDPESLQIAFSDNVTLSCDQIYYTTLPELAHSLLQYHAT